MQRYEQFFKLKNNVKQKNLSPLLACNSKSIFPTSDSFPLIMSHLWQQYTIAYGQNAPSCDPLRRKGNPNWNWTCFVYYLKIFNTVLKYNIIIFSSFKYFWFWVIDQTCKIPFLINNSTYSRTTWLTKILIQFLCSSDN